MKEHWYDWTYDHLEELTQCDSKEAEALVAVYSLDAEFNNGGLIQYLMNESGDTWESLRHAFALGDCHQGFAWMKSVEAIFGGEVPRQRDARLDAISSMSGYARGEDPFEEPDSVLRGGLNDKVQDIGAKLVGLCKP